MRTGIPEGEAARKLMADLQLPGPDILKKIHTPVIYLMGGPSDIAFQNRDAVRANLPFQISTIAGYIYAIV
jgi:hypothetical protein